jgi:hypothetical protein
VVALASHEKGLLNFRVEDGCCEGDGTLSGATAVEGMPLGCSDAVETVDADVLCEAATEVIEDWVGVRSCAGIMCESVDISS